MATPKPLKHLYLVDGSGFIFRAFHALPPMTRADGTPVNAVLGFCNMLLKLLGEADADHLAVVFDSARKTFRTDLYTEYKAHRPEPPAELIPQFGLIRKACEAFNVMSVELEGFEADDLIATYARHARAQGAEVTIVSSDKDLMQLIKPGVVMYDPLKNKTLGPEAVFEKFGVGPERVRDIQALAGDSSDNIPGVPSIGVKTAATLINQFGDLETLLARTAEIPQPKRRAVLEEHAAMARLSYQLVSLCEDTPLPQPLEAFERQTPETDALTAFLQEQGFRALLARLDKGAAPPTTGAPRAPAPQATYELVTDLTALQTWIATATAQGFVAIDTETTSLDALQAKLVGVSLALSPGKACYIPLAHKQKSVQQSFLGPASNATLPQQIPMDQAIAALRPLLENPAVLKIGHNLKYDMLVLSQHNLNIAPIEDTMVLSYTLDGNQHSHGMDALARLHLDYETIPFADVAGKGRDQITFDYVEIEAAKNYAAEDADITLRLYQMLKPRLREEHGTTLYETLDRPLVSVLFEMERTGIGIDPTRLHALSLDFTKRLGALEEQIFKQVGHSFNMGSPKQVGEVLFDELNLGGDLKLKKGKSGAYGTGADILEDLAAQGHALAEHMLEWRQLSKLKSTYTDALLTQINPQTKRLHTSYAMTLTATGRLSSSNPNLQNIPTRTEEGRKIRGAFIAKPGHVFLSLDYSQIELRILAHMANLDTLRDAFLEGRDIHKATAAEVFGLPLDAVDSEHRRRAKAINFGIIYGISAFGLARQLKISKADAAQYIETYNKRYPGILAFMEAQKETARKMGYVETLLGRRLYIHGINDKNGAARGFAERQAINAPLQGTAADIIKRAMVRLPQALADHHLNAKMLLQVHDELILEVAQDIVEATCDVARDVMASAAKLSVPLVVDAGTGKTWADAH